MRTLGLDPSLRAYGWAIHDSEMSGLKRRIASGHEGTLPSTVPVARFLHFQALVHELINKYKPNAVGIESPAYSAGPFQTIHFGLMMFSLVPIFEARLNCALFDPATLKALAKEDPTKKKGEMSKLDMQRRVQIDTFDPHVINDNEADAYLVGLYTARLIELIKGSLQAENLTPSERRIFVMKTKKVKTLKGIKIKHMGHVFRANNRYYEFEKVPPGSVSLPDKTGIRPEILAFLEDLEDETNTNTKTKKA